MESDGSVILNIIMFGIVTIIALGAILGFGDKRKIVVYEDYDDIILTFSVTALAFFAFICLGNSESGLFYALLGYSLTLASLYVLGFTVWRTFKANHKSLWKTALAVVTKFPLAFLWIWLIKELLNPSGKSGFERATNRASALMFLALLTPIISALIVEKTGHFSPRGILKGKRIGSVRNHL